MDMDFCRSVADTELRYKFFDKFFKRQILRNNFFKRTSNYRLLNIHGRIQILYNGIILWQYKNFEKKQIQDSRRVLLYIIHAKKYQVHLHQATTKHSLQSLANFAPVV